MGLSVPVFRSPPRLVGADRTICCRNGHLVVAVRSRGRPICDVTTDVVDGVLVCNRLRRGEQARVRRRLLQAAERELPDDADVPLPDRRYPVRAEARVA